MSFWVKDYIRMLKFLGEEGYAFQPVASFLRHASERAAILRHDVDRRPAMAVQMAEHEARVGIHSTYYFRCNRHGVFPGDACRRIAGYGHEIGYHYEELSRRGGNRALALVAFRRNLTLMRNLAPCVTVSMHGSPFSAHDNRRLLDGENLAEFGLLGDASLSLHRYHPVYFTDAGGAWNKVEINFRDRLGLMPLGVSPLERTDLVATLRQWTDRLVVFNLHPERWAVTRSQFSVALATDRMASALKGFYRPFRK